MPLETFRIKFDGIFDFDEVYNAMNDWLTEREYEVKETKYKNKPPELEIAWKTDRKITHYVKQKIDVDFYFWNMKEVEVIKSNTKKKMLKARVRIEVKPDVELGYEDYLKDKSEWESTPFLIKLKEFFNKWVLKRDIDMLYEGQAYYDAVHFVDFIKHKLNMKLDKGVF
jgi:hypothetical protein